MKTTKARTRLSTLLIPSAVAVVAYIGLSVPAFAGPEGTPTGAVSGTGQTGIVPYFNHKGNGTDFIQASHTTRTRTNPGITQQTCPFNLPMPALPPGAIPVRTIVSWNYLTDDLTVAVDTITINGNPVNGAQCGQGDPDLCWGQAGGVSYITQTDVTGFVNFGGNNVIGDACDKVLGTDPEALGEGITILTVFDVPGSGARNVDVYCGYVSTRSGPVLNETVTVTLDFSNKFLDGDLHFFLNALDGQTSGDNLFVNANNADLVTGIAGDAWRGKLGPHGQPNPDNNLYDVFDEDIGPGGLGYKVGGAQGVDFMTDGFGDCIGHSFAAASFLIEPLGACCVGEVTSCQNALTESECNAKSGAWFEKQTCDDFNVVPPPAGSLPAGCIDLGTALTGEQVWQCFPDNPALEFDRIVTEIGKNSQFFKVASIQYVCKSTGETVQGQFKDHIKKVNCNVDLADHETWGGNFTQNCFDSVDVFLVPVVPTNDLVIKEAHVFGSLGACCDQGTIPYSCTDDVIGKDCEGPKDKWLKGERCADVDCAANVVPAVTEWGLASLVLLLVAGLTIKFRGAFLKRA